MATLVLNASYEPLGVIQVRRAVGLVLDDRAEIVVANGTLRAAAVAVDLPAVIRLRSYVRVPYRRPVVTRHGVLARDGHRCGYCGARATTVDHIMPTSRGGARRSWDNLVAACVRCNGRKGNRTPAEAGLQLRTEPRIPTGREPWVVCRVHRAGRPVDDLWRPYLAA